MKTSYLSLVPIAALASACADTDVEIDGSTITDSKRSEIVTNMPSRDNSVSSAYMGLSAYFPNATALDYYWIGDFGYPGIMIMMDVQGEDMNVYSDNNNWFYYGAISLTAPLTTPTRRSSGVTSTLTSATPMPS